MINWGGEGTFKRTNEGEKMELLLTEKLVFAATCTFGGAFVFNRHIHTGTADYKIWNA